jgi:hypothetical protein
MIAITPRSPCDPAVSRNRRAGFCVRVDYFTINVTKAELSILACELLMTDFEIRSQAVALPWWNLGH